MSQGLEVDARFSRCDRSRSTISMTQNELIERFRLKTHFRFCECFHSLIIFSRTLELFSVGKHFSLRRTIGNSACVDKFLP